MVHRMDEGKAARHLHRQSGRASAVTQSASQVHFGDPLPATRGPQPLLDGCSAEHPHSERGICTAGWRLPCICYCQATIVALRRYFSIELPAMDRSHRSGAAVLRELRPQEGPVDQQDLTDQLKDFNE